MYVIGLTGGIGSGKSVVAQYFKRLGTEVIDADIAARKIVEKGSPALTKIVEHFGVETLNSDSTLNRAFLRTRIFNDPQERLWLEALLHPLIRTWIQHALSIAVGPYTILETPLLLETAQHLLTDRILVIDTPEELQIRRASNRDNNNEEQIRAIMKTQLPREERRGKADDILDNSGSLDHIERQVTELHHKYLTLAAQKKGAGT
ncbi:MAG: dephospho-CoA kinase [Porticoccus sp.]|nr:dephospho-CoA kinase [Porticoccus sp.]